MNAFGGGIGNIDAVPAGIFDGCKPTAGSAAVVEVVKSACSKESWVALDLIGGFSFITAMFSIDEHPMWVYAMDGEYVTPQKVEAISITNGDRYSVLVKLNNTGDFKIRVASIGAPQILSGYGNLRVRNKGDGTTTSDGSVAYINDVGMPATPSSVVSYFSQAIAKPYPKSPVKQTADAMFKLEMRIVGASYRWALNNTVFTPTDFENSVPALFRPDPKAANNVTISTLNGTWVDLVIMSTTSPMPSHPIHKHGNKMYMIGAGTGAFKYPNVAAAIAETPESFNLVDPPRRDTFATLPALTDQAWMVVRYQVTNPGAWLLHCHIQNHMMGGMNMIIQDGVDHWPKVPNEYKNF